MRSKWRPSVRCKRVFAGLRFECEADLITICYVTRFIASSWQEQYLNACRNIERTNHWRRAVLMDVLPVLSLCAPPRDTTDIVALFVGARVKSRQFRENQPGWLQAVWASSPRGLVNADLLRASQQGRSADAGRSAPIVFVASATTAAPPRGCQHITCLLPAVFRLHRCDPVPSIVNFVASSKGRDLPASSGRSRAGAQVRI